jgi:hypothetical protein
MFVEIRSAVLELFYTCRQNDRTTLIQTAQFAVATNETKYKQHKEI